MKIRSALSLTILLVLSPMTACAQSTLKSNANLSTVSENQEPKCTISAADREALLNLDYNAFDQSLPDGGWRKYQQCPQLTREIIDEYTSRHEKTLQKQQWDVLVWHSGQISAMMGDYADAISKMKKTFKSNEKATDAFLWNPYARATIAFLKREKSSLVSERKKLARGMSPFNRLNLRKVDAFIRCFDSSYLEAYSETCNPPETNLERIKSLAVPFDRHKSLPKDFFGFGDFLKMKKIILIGEMHGTSTVPEIFGNLVDSIADSNTKTLVVLEIPQSSQKTIDSFLINEDDSVLKADPFFTRDFQDGRSSEAMVKLLRRLAKLPNTTVLCMDPMSGFNTMTGQERDTGMASFINSHRVGYDHTLVLSGNIHSSASIGTPWDKRYRPMGYELKAMIKDLRDDELLNILIRYGKLDAWNCQGNQASDCKVHYGEEISSDYSMAVSYPTYFIWEIPLVDGHGGSIFIRSAKASMPFVLGSKSNLNEATK